MQERLRADAFRVGESPEVPADVALPNRNFMNLLEVPVLFYLACLVQFAARRQDPSVTTLAWAYVALRIAHSIVHLSYNRVMHRLLVFTASNFVLVTLWLRVVLPLASE